MESGGNGWRERRRKGAGCIGVALHCTPMKMCSAVHDKVWRTCYVHTRIWFDQRLDNRGFKHATRLAENEGSAYRKGSINTCELWVVSTQKKNKHNLVNLKTIICSSVEKSFPQSKKKRAEACRGKVEMKRETQCWIAEICCGSSEPCAYYMANMPWHTHQAHETVRLSGCSLVTLATSLLLIFVVRFSQTKFHFFCTSNIYNMAQICIQPHLLAVELHGLVYKHVRFHGLGLETAGILCRHFLKERGVYGGWRGIWFVCRSSSRW